MQRILIIILGLIATANGIAMEQPTPQAHHEVILSAPVELSANTFKIKAFLAHQEIGSIRYISRNQDKGIWRIRKLKVAEQHRHTDNKVGSKLFSACIQDMRKQNATKVEWTAMPREGSNLTVAQLESIYERMIAKLELSKHIFYKKPFGYCTDMALQFQQQVAQQKQSSESDETL